MAEIVDCTGVVTGGGQNTDPWSMDYPNGLPKWTTLKWTTPKKNTIPDDWHVMRSCDYIIYLHCTDDDQSYYSGFLWNARV